ncbi:065L [Cherax quadricarinatus iridovirus]|uniref:DNA-directed RNA polymerases II and IV subunit 5A n=1 Tax=Shrimp hemocyte iridescent virus TaxID=2039780 RepID=A0A291B0S4_9VIRU|nr:065L [Cherax quadricarinatus iridovirus]YP_010084838.1 DNA-directed RNA polymerases II and IV subunit 5A [Shrimp hemocyte iridescent virus]UPA43383.1 DNA-directed RNA polymerases II and IV subunit 5 A [Iridovirus CN01]ASZ85045.1 065L [Cherax quadricarinatus iridovirus]ATE87095.1 DNA-directed RNA polymerases II and IV subunit 5A [Shrimp hemocyte iridescent virus]UPA43459.1 DNA-directed RNA polymerases II and IV subunit 5 A [Iridovirus CN01]UPA43653.1 DNA-directed RNA polymerases II and IV s
MNNFETIKKNIKLMMTRRGCIVKNFVESEDFFPKYIVENENGETVFVYFIEKSDNVIKITTSLLKNIMAASKNIVNIVIVHNTVLTPDAKNCIQKGVDLYNFQTFTYDEMSFDYFEILPEDPQIKILDSKIPNWNKLPILLYTDPLARYMNAKPGDILQGKFGDDLITLRRCV